MIARLAAQTVAACLLSGFVLFAHAQSVSLEPTAPAARLALSPQQQALLTQHPLLRLGVKRDLVPLEFIDDQGQFNGVVANYMRALEARLGLQLQFVSRDSWPELLQAFESGELDALAAVVPTAERQKTMRFTAPYLRRPIGLIVRSDAPFVERLSDLAAGKRLAIIQGSGPGQRLAASNPHLVLIPTKNSEQSLMAVATGAADITISPLLVSHYFMQQPAFSHLRVAATVDEVDASVAMAFRPGLEALVPLFDLAIADIGTAERAALRAQWTHIASGSRTAPSVLLMWGIGGLMALLLLGGGLWWWLRRQRLQWQAVADKAVAQSRTLLEAMPAVLWTVRLEPGRPPRMSYYGSSFRKIDGIDPNKLGESFEEGSRFIGPDDKQQLLQRLEQNSKTLTPFHFEHKILGTGGTDDWVYLQMVPRKDADGLTWYGCSVDITERKALEVALAQSRSQLHELTSSIPGALWQVHRSKDGQMHFSYMSDGMSSIIEHKPALAGKSTQEVLAAFVHPEDALVLGTLFDRLGVAPLIHSGRYRLRKGSDGWVWVQTVIRAMPMAEDGSQVFNGITLDATQQHETEQALIAEQQRVEDIARSFPGVIFQGVRNSDGSSRFTYISDGITRLNGKPQRTRDGREMMQDYDHVHLDDRDRVRAASEACIAECGSLQIDYRLLNINGGSRWVHCAMSARAQGDGSTIINGLLLDAEPSKQLEAELRAASERAEMASRAKTRFLANMSHEIRTPMNAVIGLAHLAMTSESNPAQAARIGKIHKAGKGLLKLLNDILEYARLDAGKYTPTLAPMELGELIESLELFCRPAAETKGLQFAINHAKALPLAWQGDATRIQQVLLNLITNAIKFTDRGSVTLVISALASPASGLQFVVRDTGIGMTDAQMQRVFEAFEQASDATERRHGGTGLGLSISRELVTAMGGQIQVQSTPGQGSAFTVQLPLQAITVAPRPTAFEVGFDTDMAIRLARLAQCLQQRDTTGARLTLQGLRLALIPKGRDSELHAMERLLEGFDIEAAQMELAQLRTRWGIKPNPRNV